MKYFIFSISLLIISSLKGQETYRNWAVVDADEKERIALIMANNTYESGGSLQNPIPMAKELEAKLKSEGFDVLVGRDLNRAEMLEVLNDFAKKFTSYDFSMIFYLGHGFQIDGENYLIPIDANPMTKDDVEVQAINVDYVMKKIDNPDKPKVVVLDACRDNPFASNWSSNERAANPRGFGTVSAPRNAEIFFTTAEGTRVKDDNPYLAYFMDELNEGTCISDIKRNVSKRIYEFNSDQIPASYGQLFDEVCFGEKSDEETSDNKVEKSSSQIAAKATPINSTESRLVNENVKLTIGDEYMGGVIISLDESGEHGIVMSGLGITIELSLSDARDAVINSNYEGFSDWEMIVGDQFEQALANLSIQFKPNLHPSLLYDEYGGRRFIKKDFRLDKDVVELFLALNESKGSSTVEFWSGETDLWKDGRQSYLYINADGYFRTKQRKINKSKSHVLAVRKF